MSHHRHGDDEHDQQHEHHVDGGGGLSHRSEMIQALANSLEQLRQLKPKSKEDVAHWYVLARRLEAELVSRGGLSPELPRLLWHYLADADIRSKDEQYAALQDRQMLLLVQYLKRGEVPSDDDLTRYAAHP